MTETEYLSGGALFDASVAANEIEPVPCEVKAPVVSVIFVTVAVPAVIATVQARLFPPPEHDVANDDRVVLVAT